MFNDPQRAGIEINGPDSHPELAERYARYGDENVLAVHSLHPAGMDAHWAVYRAAMTPTRTLRKREREMIALVVSVINGCRY